MDYYGGLKPPEIWRHHWTGMPVTHPSDPCTFSSIKRGQRQNFARVLFLKPFCREYWPVWPQRESHPRIPCCWSAIRAAWHMGGAGTCVWWFFHLLEAVHLQGEELAQSREGEMAQKQTQNGGAAKGLQTMSSSWAYEQNWISNVLMQAIPVLFAIIVQSRA